jgi:ribosomal protein S18 acetylase RimI-like enzyme
MNSSPAPPVDDGLTFYAAARLHARRFDRSVLSSMLLLNASDHLLTDSAGGVLTLTDLGRSKWRTASLAATFVGGLAVTLWAGFRGLLLFGAAVVAVLLILLVVVAPKVLRSRQAVRRHRVTGSAWLVTDVATVPGHGAGDRLVGRACKLADDAMAMLVLSVADATTTAIKLYERHNFEMAGRDGQKLLMTRSPA